MIRTAPKGTATLADPTAWTWTDAAACHGQDLDLFFGRDGERQAAREVREEKAKGVCAGCPSRTACLEYALAQKPTGQHGVWGGTTAEERIVIRRNRMRRNAAERAA